MSWNKTQGNKNDTQGEGKYIPQKKKCDSILFLWEKHEEKRLSATN